MREKRTPFPPDADATWEYWSAGDSLEHGIPDEYVWERLRDRRDKILAATDYRILGDAPWDIKPWIDYRAALRDLPENTVNPRKAIWPTPPE